jgi:hypothetical protein
MTIAGRSATPARAVQLERELTPAAMPAADTNDAQNMAMTTLLDTSCMLPV